MLFPCHIMRGLVGHSKEFEFHGKNRKTLIKYKNITTTGCSQLPKSQITSIYLSESQGKLLQYKITLNIENKCVLVLVYSVYGNSEEHNLF